MFSLSLISPSANWSKAKSWAFDTHAAYWNGSNTSFWACLDGADRQKGVTHSDTSSYDGWLRSLFSRLTFNGASGSKGVLSFFVFVFLIVKSKKIGQWSDPSWSWSM